MCLSWAFMRDVSGLFLVLPRVRKSKKVLDSGFHAMNSGFQVVDSGFQLLVGFRIPWTVFHIAKPRILDSASKNFSDSGIRIPIHGETSSPWNLRNYMVMVKPQLRVKKNCLPSIISNFTNNKSELWKLAVRLSSFQKPLLQSVSIFFKFIHSCLFLYLLGYYYLLLSFWGVIFMFHSIWRPLPPFDFW